MLSLGGVEHLMGGSKKEGRVTCATLLDLCNREAVTVQIDAGVEAAVQAGKMLDVKPTGIKIKGRRSTPGRYFQVAGPGTGWGGANIEDPLTILDAFKPAEAWSGLRFLMVSTTGEYWQYFELDDALIPRVAEASEALRAAVSPWRKTVSRRCVRFCSWGAGGRYGPGSLRAGVVAGRGRCGPGARQIPWV